MNEFASNVLMAGMMSSLRHDDAVARQGIMNHQTAAHMADLAFTRDFTELSIPEAYATAGLQMAHGPGQNAGLNAADRTPVTKS